MSYVFELNRQAENLNKIIEESVYELNNIIKDKKIKFNSYCTEVLYSLIDKTRIKQVIKDLLLVALNSMSLKKDISITLNENNDQAEIVVNSIEGKFNVQEFKLVLEVLNEIMRLHGGNIIIKSGKNEEKTRAIIQLPIKNLKESLSHIYVIYKSGLPLYDYSFNQKNDELKSSVISGAIIGIMTFLEAIVQGVKQIKSIDHGDRKLLFQTNYSKKIIFVLIVKDDLVIFRKRLVSLVEEFDLIYQDLIKDIKRSSIISANWQNLDTLIKKYFEN